MVDLEIVPFDQDRDSPGYHKCMHRDCQEVIRIAFIACVNHWDELSPSLQKRIKKLCWRTKDIDIVKGMVAKRLKAQWGYK